jgi:hypothetical protein
LSPTIVNYVAENTNKFPLAPQLARELNIRKLQADTSEKQDQIDALERLSKILSSN